MEASSQILFTAAFSLLFSLYAWYRISWRFQKHPDLKRGYIVLFFAWLCWVNSGSLLREFGGALSFNSIVYSARPIAVAVWILLFGGASVLQKYPGLPFVPVGSARRLQGYAFLFLCLELLYPLLARHVVDVMERFAGMMPLIFIGMWLAILYVLSIMSGWQWLAESYRFRGKYQGQISSMQSGSIGLLSANHCLRIGTGDQGLYLGMILPFRLWHPSLVVPWSDVVVGRRKLLFFRSVVLEFAKAPGVLLVFSETTASRILGFTGFTASPEDPMP